LVRRPEGTDIAETLGETFTLWFDIGDVSAGEVDEAREAVERTCVRLAAARRTLDDISEMRRIIAAAEEKDLPLVEFLEYDVAFHRVVAEAARNRLLNLPMQAIHMVRLRTNLFLAAHDRQEVLNQHRSLCDAIEARNADLAESCLEAHIAHLAHERKRAAEAELSDVPPK
jgi:DNA-binding FadR family transcriptional regulator